MAEVTAGFFEQLFDVLHRLFRLRARVTQADQVAGEIGADLTAHIHRITGPHGLA